EDVVEAFTIAQRGIKDLVAAQQELLKKIDRPAKMKWTKGERPEGLELKVKEVAEGQIREAINQKDKHKRVESVERVKEEAAEKLLSDFPENSNDIKELLGDVEYHTLRSQVLDSGHRVDGRKANEVRAIT